MWQGRAALLTGAGIGAGFMYFLDPERGRRRRALVKDQVAHSGAVSTDALETSGRDLAHRGTGIAARVRQTLRRAPVDDHVLSARVRAQLGRLVSHPHAIEVEASDGRVTLRGPVLEAEVPRLLRRIRRVGGVHDVVNALEEHKHAGNVPALQGGTTTRRPPQPDFLQRQWAPATRLLAGTAGTALAGYGAVRRDLPGAMLATAGVTLAARAATNVELKRLTGLGGGRRAVDVQKSLTIDAPIGEVFRFWTAYENFPKFMSRVLEVRPSTRDRQSHWKISGPAGMPVEFDAEVTTSVPNERFGWKTLEGAPVAHAGLVQFESLGEGRTRVHVRMSYNPPAGWLGHGVAAAFGVDPKSSLDADLLRMKTLLETGRAARDAAQPSFR